MGKNEFQYIVIGGGIIGCCLVLKILNEARFNGIQLIDTATSYGTAESVLGNYDLNFFSIVTKTPKFEKNIITKLDAEKLINRFKQSLQKLNINSCYGLLLHHKEEMFKNLQSGSVVYDLAAIQGGNTAFTKVDEIVEKNGVKILGEANILNKLPVSASNLYAKNVFNFISNLYDKENKKLNINLEDEIIEKTLIK